MNIVEFGREANRLGIRVSIVRERWSYPSSSNSWAVTLRAEADNMEISATAVGNEMLTTLEEAWEKFQRVMGRGLPQALLAAPVEAAREEEPF